jgi:hypothetical protein
MSLPGDVYPLVMYIFFANYPGEEYLPQLLGISSAPTPSDLAYAITQADGTVLTPTEFTCPMPQWSNPYPMDCYVTAVWFPPDKFGSQDFNDCVITDIPGQFTFTGNSEPS